MGLRSLSVIAMTTLVIVSILPSHAATGKSDAGGAPWGLNLLNASWPIVAIGLLVAVFLAGTLGLFDFDPPRAVLLLIAIAFLVYEFYSDAISRVLSGLITR